MAVESSKVAGMFQLTKMQKRKSEFEAAGESKKARCDKPSHTLVSIQIPVMPEKHYMNYVAFKKNLRLNPAFAATSDFVLQRMSKKVLITRDIKCSTKNILVVWCPQARGRELSTVLTTTDHIEWRRSSWISGSCQNESRWGLMVVEYPSLENAQQAGRKLDKIMTDRCMKSMILPKLLNFFTSSEVLHPEFRVGFTTVIIRCNLKLDKSDYKELKAVLQNIGQLKRSYRRRQEDDSFCLHATYLFMTQAYLAALLLDGWQTEVGRLRAEVRETDKEKFLKREVLADVKMFFRNQQ